MNFFNTLQKIVDEAEIVIDRPAGSIHPRYADYIYPFDYGYLVGTTSADGDGMDCWIGSEGGKTVTAIIVVIDPVKKDSEIKVLLGCTDEDISLIEQCHNRGEMRGLVVKR